MVLKGSQRIPMLWSLKVFHSSETWKQLRERERESSPKESSESGPEGQRPHRPGLYTSRSEIVSETASTTRDNLGPDAPSFRVLASCKLHSQFIIVSLLGRSLYLLRLFLPLGGRHVQIENKFHYSTSHISRTLDFTAKDSYLQSGMDPGLVEPETSVI